MVTIEEKKSMISEAELNQIPEMEAEYVQFNLFEMARLKVSTGENNYGGVPCMVESKCVCGAETVYFGYSNWSQDLSETVKKLKAQMEEHTTEKGVPFIYKRRYFDYIRYTAHPSLGMYGMKNMRKELLLPHHPKCMARTKVPEIFYSKRTVTREAFIILDSPDGEQVRFRRYEQRLEYDGSGSFSSYLHPKGQFYFTEEGKIEHVLTTRKGKKGLTVSPAKYPKKAIEILRKTGVDAARSKGILHVHVTDAAKESSAWTKTGIKEFYEGLQSSNRYGRRYEEGQIETLISFMQYREKHPAVEQLVKAGFFQYALDAVRNETDLADSVMAEISLPKPIQKHIKFLGKNIINQLKQIHTLSPLTDEFVRIISHQGNLPSLPVLVDLMREHGYTCRELASYSDRVWASQAIEFKDMIQLLNDTCRMAAMLNRKVDRFPKALKQEHNVLARDYSFVEDELMNKEYEQKRRTAIADAYRMENNRFLIREPMSLSEINQEGQSLKHCVASYAKNVVIGKTTILFLREQEDPDRPFFTIEVRDGLMVQCRGKNNKIYTNWEDDSLISFIHQWKKVKNIA